MNFAQGFELWRPLGLTGGGQPIEFDALVAIHQVHRIMALAVFVAIGVLAWRMHQAGVLNKQVRWLVTIAVLQLFTGISNVVLGWPLVAAVLHTAGAAALVGILTWAACESRASVVAVHATREVSA
jgi:cytochrome c oxidase assembly protein subunit 15